MTWVLIIWMSAGYKGGPTAVPGYQTEKMCVEAGIEAAKRARVRDVFCIPGPHR